MKQGFSMFLCKTITSEYNVQAIKIVRTIIARGFTRAFRTKLMA